MPEASLAGTVVQPASGPALADRRVRRQLFEPHLVIMVQATFVVIDKHTRSNVH